MSVQLDCGCPANLVKAGAPHNLNCPTNGLLATIDHAFQPYQSGKEALVGVCCECGDYHDERRTRTEALAGKVQDAYDKHVGKAFMINVAGRDVQIVAEGVPIDPEANLKTELHAATGISLFAVREAASCARRLKTAELEFHAAQQAYAIAIKQLSDEAVK